MSQKQNSQSFLDKFKGRANRINKEGITKALDGQSPLDIFLPTPKKSRRQILNASQQFHKSDLMDPETKPSIRKRMNLKPLPMPEYRLDKKHENNNNSSLQNSIQDNIVTSKAQSRKNEVQKNTTFKFGKYLKLDEEALKHLDFLRLFANKPPFQPEIPRFSSLQINTPST